MQDYSRIKNRFRLSNLTVNAHLNRHGQIRVTQNSSDRKRKSDTLFMIDVFMIATVVAVMVAFSSLTRI